ncbi:MAG: 5-oxoprolinase subunit PxpB [Bacteroidetes bacterium]|nr:MAG: 5-oxoprolinase subunit PxpB [Bacteroidota bacterium]
MLGKENFTSSRQIRSERISSLSVLSFSEAICNFGAKEHIISVSYQYFPRLKPYGDRAVLVEFEQQIDDAINARVVALQRALAGTPGISCLIPAYCSLTVVYQPDVWSYARLETHIKACFPLRAETAAAEGRRLYLPVCYQPAFAPDMPQVAAHTGLDGATIVDLHCKATYRVFMLGFLPGFVYLGKLPPALYCPRKERPRLRVPACSVGIAGFQTGIYPVEAPGGWQLIGRTPIPPFNPEHESPFLLESGDEVSFYPISEDRFHQIARQWKRGEYPRQLLYEQAE